MKTVRMLVIGFLGTFCVLTFSSSVLASMSSTNYSIDWDSIGFGGDDNSTSASYQLIDSVGGVSSGTSTSTTYTNASGYRNAGFEPITDFDVYIQNTATQVGASSFSSLTVTVTSTSGYSTGDMIAIIQDEGVSQVAAIGKIASVAGNDMTVDFLTGSTPTIDGTNDYVYELNVSSYSFGTLINTQVDTGIVAWETRADVSEGYGVYVYEDDNLRSGALIINDVSDGTVSAGSTEYGGRSSDSTLSSSTFDTQDSAFTQNFSLVGSRADNSFKSRDFVTLKAAISASQANGSYSHNLYFIYVGDY